MTKLHEKRIEIAIAISCLVFIGILASIAFADRDIRQDPLTIATNATVALVDEKGRTMCSGVIIDAHYVLTNAHCVMNTFEKGVAFRDVEETSSGVVVFRGTPGELDVAILRVNDPIPYPALPVRCEAPRYGEEIVVIGHPFGERWTTTWGHVSHQDSKRDNRWLVNAMINPGNSGGTVLDNEGNLLAISTDMMAYSAGFRGPSGHTGISGVTALSAVCQDFRSMGVMA